MNLSPEKEKLFKLMSLSYDMDTYYQYYFFKNIKLNSAIALSVPALASVFWGFLNYFRDFLGDFVFFGYVFLIIISFLFLFFMFYFVSNLTGRLFNKKYALFKVDIEYIKQHIKKLSIEELKFFMNNVNPIYKGELNELLKEKEFCLNREDIINEISILENIEDKNNNIVVERININQFNSNK